MKKTSIACLCCLGWLASVGLAQQVGPERDPNAPIRREVRRSPAPKPVKDGPRTNKMAWAVTGYGASQEDAFEEAVKNAKTAVSDFLHGHGLRVEPTLDEVRKLVTTKKEEKMTENDELVAITATSKMLLNVELSDSDYAKYLKRDRRISSHERTMGIGKGLAVLLIGLTFLGGYLRLEEACKGYYTTWLRLGALAVVGALASTVLWWLMRSA